MKPLDSTLVSKLKFIKRSLIYIDYDYSLQRKFVVHEIDYNTAQKVVTLLKGGSRPLQSTDKVFILKDHESRLDDLKEYIKQSGAKVTNTISQATVLLGNNNITQSKPYLSTSKYIHIPNGQNIHVNDVTYDGKTPSHLVSYNSNDLDLTDTSIIDNTAIVYSESYADNYQYNFVNYTYRVAANSQCYLTNYAVSIIYQILAQQLPVLNEHDLINSQSQNNVIDENSYSVLNGMLGGSSEDILTAQTIIYNCNVDKSFYWLKKLIDSHSYRIVNKKKKAYKSFVSRLNVSDLYEIANMNNWEFIKECIQRDVFYANVKEKLQEELYKEIYDDLHYVSERKYNDCVTFEFKIDYDKLIADVKS